MTGPMMAMQDLGVDVQHIAELADVPIDQLEQGLGTMAPEVVWRLISAFDALYHDDGNLFERLQWQNVFVRFGSFGPLVDSLIFCETGVAMLSALSSIHYLIFPNSLKVSVNQDTVSISWSSDSVPCDSTILPWMQIGFVQMMIERGYRNRTILPQQITFISTSERFTKIARTKYQCELSQGARYTLVYPRIPLESPFDCANPRFANAIYHKYLLRSESLPRQDIDLIRDEIRRLILVGGQATLEGLAESFCVTPRTIQRRLKSLGVTFGELYRSEREKLAKELLKNSSEPLVNIASKLGFTEITTFSRAFKLWTNVTPSQYRKNGSVTAETEQSQDE